MENTPERYNTHLANAIKNIKVADHIIYITYPIIKDKRLLLKSLDSTYDAAISIISAILQYEYVWKRISLSDDSRENFQTFTNKCAKNYNITEQEIQQIKELITTVENHKKSSMEFPRREKIVIMSDSLKTQIIDSEKIRNYLKISKILFQKARNVISSQ